MPRENKKCVTEGPSPCEQDPRRCRTDHCKSLLSNRNEALRKEIQFECMIVEAADGNFQLNGVQFHNNIHHTFTHPRVRLSIATTRSRGFTSPRVQTFSLFSLFRIDQQSKVKNSNLPESSRDENRHGRALAWLALTQNVLKTCDRTPLKRLSNQPQRAGPNRLSVLQNKVHCAQ